MGRCILRQPNGRLALFESETDDFVILDEDEDQIRAFLIEDEVRQARARAVEDVERMLADVRERGTSSGLGRTWEKAITSVRRVHGEAVARLRRAYRFEEG